MSLFGGTSSFSFGSSLTTASKDVEVQQPPSDTISCLKFSPNANFLAATSWDNKIRCWEIQATGTSVPKAEQSHLKPILSCCWHADGTKLFSAGADNQAKIWDLASNQAVVCAQHDAPIKTVHWIQAPNYQCLMTGSWDKTLKFWDTRQSTPIKSFNTMEKVYCADVIYPMAVVSTAQRGILVYQLMNEPAEFKKIESPLKYQHRSIAICKDANGVPTGFALGSVEGRIAMQYIQPADPKDNFTFKCHRSEVTSANQVQDIYAVNDIAFHPQHGTLATAGSDGKYSFWDKDARTKLKTSDGCPQPITACCFNFDGSIFSYAIGYDWTKGHEFYNTNLKPAIFLRNCGDELKSRSKK
ncbi:mRNA export factor RAE1 [Hydra vulgaris]|uniref:mRNA export factor RAE1 n=1 Tax=Hydra vulgaris TaxID=6087 RepID=A0ABM4CZY1_HYDVU